jgi:hypothetical protein
MTSEEYTILTFLKESPDAYFSRKEIARRAVRRQVYEENQHWADAPLASLLLQKLVEEDNRGCYRCKKDDLLP